MDHLDFWLRVKSEIKNKGISQQDFCKSIGINPRTLQNWIYRSILPQVEEGIIIATALGVTLEYLVTGETAKRSPECLKISTSKATQRIVKKLIPLDEREIESVEVGVSGIMAAMGLPHNESDRDAAVG